MELKFKHLRAHAVARRNFYRSGDELHFRMAGVSDLSCFFVNSEDEKTPYVLLLAGVFDNQGCSWETV